MPDTPAAQRCRVLHFSSCRSVAVRGRARGVGAESLTRPPPMRPTAGTDGCCDRAGARAGQEEEKRTLQQRSDAVFSLSSSWPDEWSAGRGQISEFANTALPDSQRRPNGAVLRWVQ